MTDPVEDEQDYPTQDEPATPPDDEPTWGDGAEVPVERLPEKTNAAEEYRRKFTGGGFE